MRKNQNNLTRLIAVASTLAAMPLLVASCGELPSADEQQAGAATITSSSQITQSYHNASGSHQTAFVPVGSATPDPGNPFFQSLGTNGRVCASCHQPAASWGITPSQVQADFNSTGGTSPIFRTNDGSNSPNLPVSTTAQRQAAYSLLLNRGVIRVGIGIPATAEFNLTFVEDPYQFASANELSLFRRPLPSTNLRFLATVMWDGREGGVASQTNGGPVTQASNTLEANIRNADLAHQSNDATRGHAQAAVDLTSDQQNAIVNFESSLFTAQITDNAAGSLTASGATGGPGALSGQPFHVLINDVLGADPVNAPTPTPFAPHVFSVYDAWAKTATFTPSAAQASIQRGQNIFNSRTFTISGVRGVNDVIGVASLTGTCTVCHDAPNVGNHSVSLPLDLGLTDPNTFNTDTTPRYTLVNKTTGQTIRTSDPGRALIDGKWAHVATFKGPILRGLASRPPYFHNGFAATLPAVVNFYDTRFHIGFTVQEATDLANFLAAL
jgi:hypothetical protein